MTTLIKDTERGLRVRHWPHFYEAARARETFNVLRDTLPWEQEEVVMMGKKTKAARLTATFGDHAGLSYGYAGVKKGALPWTPLLAKIKAEADAAAGATTNYAVLNLYRDGHDHIGWHADKEADLVSGAPILSFSLGAERDFLLKPNDDGETVKVTLGSGSLLTMEGTTQQYYKHSVPKRLRCKTPRINITFRQVVDRTAGAAGQKRAREEEGEDGDEHEALKRPRH